MKNVTPVRMAQPGDDSLSCPALEQQITANRVAAAQFLHEDKLVEDGNVAKGIGSAIPYLGILIAGTTDLSNEEQIKARALLDRDERLQDLAKRKECRQ